MMRTETTTHEEITIERRVDVLPTEGQVILFEQYSLFRRSWPWILALSLVAAAATGAYFYFLVPKEYRSSIVVVPPNKTGTPLDNLLGGMSSALKDFGLSKLVGGKSGEAGFSRLSLLSTRAMLDSLIDRHGLFEEYEVPRDRRDILREILESKIEIEVSAEGPVTFSILDRDPERAAAMANDAIRIANQKASELNRRETEPITKFVAQRYDQVRAERERLGQQLSLFMQKNKIYDPEKQPSIVGSALADAEANVSAQRILVEGMERTLGPDDPRSVQARQILSSLEAERRKIATGRGGAIGGLSLQSAPSAAMTGAKLQTDYEINAKVLALLQPMYEQSRMDEIRDIPVLLVLDGAEPAKKKAKPRYSVVVASAFVGTFIAAYVVIALIAYMRAFNSRYRSYSVRRATVTTNGRGRP